MTRVNDLGATHQAVGRAHCDGTHEVARKHGFNFQNNVHFAGGGFRINRQRVINRRQLIRREFDVNNRADDTHNATGGTLAGIEFRFGKHSLVSHLILQSCSATNDLGDLCGDGALTYAVIHSRQRFHHLVGVLGSRVHCRAACGLLASSRVDQRMVNRRAQVSGQKTREHIGGFGFELNARGDFGILGGFLGGRSNDSLGIDRQNDFLTSTCSARSAVVVHQNDLVDGAFLIRLDSVIGDLARLFKRRIGGEVLEIKNRRHAAEFEEATGLLATGDNVHLDTLRLFRANRLLDGAQGRSS